MFRYLILLALFSAALACAQMHPNSITVTASRSSSVQPDQVVFAVSVTSPLTTGQNDVIAALQGSGIGLANFTGVYTSQQYVGQQYVTALQWNFTLTVPLANMKATVDMFTGLQMSFSKGSAGLSLSFSVQGLQASAQAQQAQPCSLAGLISDARAQATQIANAAGATVGSILALTNSVSDGSVTCSATVKFALGGGI
jgi:uncharacterized protein YggE